MAYTPQSWTNNDPSKPLSGTRLNYIETGIRDASLTADLAATKADAALPLEDVDGAVAAYAGDPDSQLGTALSATIASTVDAQALAGGGIIYAESFPRLDGETTDAARLGRALSACATFGARVLQLGAMTYVTSTAINVTVNNLTIRGAGEKATTFQVNANVVGWNVTGHYVSLEDMLVETPTTARTVYPVLFTDCNKGTIRRCYFQGNSAGSRRSGVSFVGGSMGVVDSCTFNHACIRIATWDVMVTNTWIWAMSCDFGVGIFGGAGNTTLNLVHVVPPEVSNTNGLAGIYIDGASGKPFSTSLTDIYLDGNPTLNLRMGIYVGDGASTVTMVGVKANRMDSDCIVIDSAYNVTIIGYSGHTNNNQGSGAREIFVTQTGAQPTERIMILSSTFLQTSAIVGTPAPAIEVHSSVGTAQVDIVDFAVKQPSGGGGYTLPEVKVPVSGGYPTQGMRGRGMLSLYQGTNSQAVASGAMGVTIDIGGASYPMAYRPRPSQIMLATEGATLPQHRIQYTTDNQIYIAFATAIAAAATLHWQAHLGR